MNPKPNFLLDTIFFYNRALAVCREKKFERPLKFYFSLSSFLGKWYSYYFHYESQTVPILLSKSNETLFINTCVRP